MVNIPKSAKIVRGGKRGAGGERLSKKKKRFAGTRWDPLPSAGPTAQQAELCEASEIRGHRE